jgi:uncharacterized protein (DUF1800 family)
MRLLGFAALPFLISACATATTSTGGTHHVDARPGQSDVLWLNRLTYGITTETISRYRELGRDRFLKEQLAPSNPPLPLEIRAQIELLRISHTDGATLLAEVTAENKRINALRDGADKEQARKTLNDRGNALANESIRRNLLQAVYSPAQLQERMVAFWMNHFSVHQYKGQIRWLVGDYEDTAVRPHALGKFRDLVLATLEHPAMLQYLDNAQNSAGHINENYARELLELHTLGIGSGYTQQDVQELARILTGAGINAGGEAPRLNKSQQALYIHRGAFEFNPARHDFGSKTLLGQRIAGGGHAEIEQAISIIVQQPACARFISRKIALYLLGDTPPTSLINRMAETFQRSDGDIATVLRVLAQSPEFAASLGHKLKDPREYVISTIRFAYDAQVIVSTRPMLNWLNAMGEAPYGRQTPDGYPLDERSWSSSGQLSRRFEIARAIGSGNAGLFDPEDGSPGSTSGFPRLANRLFYDIVDPYLSSQTRTALQKANSQQEWNTFLLAAPEFNYH